jgi:uncharacterized membrane protein YiaA
MKRLLRNAHIGMAVGLALLVVGFWPAHTSESAVGVLGVAAFFTAIGVYLGLNIRDERVRGRRPPS